MKIELELPEWCDERHIYILAGIEMAAFKLYGEQNFRVKTGRCSQCGQCCERVPFNFYFEAKENGDCQHLLRHSPKHTECGLRIGRPISCCTGMQHKGMEDHPACTVSYEVKG
jgi:hypothetical protein